jgi:hypothetical protein
MVGKMDGIRFLEVSKKRRRTGSLGLTVFPACHHCRFNQSYPSHVISYATRFLPELPLLSPTQNSAELVITIAVSMVLALTDNRQSPGSFHQAGIGESFDVDTWIPNAWISGLDK